MKKPDFTYSFVIACDHGYDHAIALGINPDILIGDLDSIHADSVYIPLLKHPVRKDDSDTMLAVKYAIENGYDHIGILCALGGRIDHLFANIQSMAYAASYGCACEIFDDEAHLLTFTGGEILLPKKEGCVLSLFSLSDSCEHVSISGAKYDAEDITLKNTFPLGLSNAWETEEIRITMGRGIMLIMECSVPIENEV